jgi:hypothetical protein
MPAVIVEPGHAAAQFGGKSESEQDPATRIHATSAIAILRSVTIRAVPASALSRTEW